MVWYILHYFLFNSYWIKWNKTCHRHSFVYLLNQQSLIFSEESEIIRARLLWRIPETSRAQFTLSAEKRTTWVRFHLPGINNWLILLDCLPLPFMSYIGRRQASIQKLEKGYPKVSSNRRDAAEMGMRLKILSIRWKHFLCLQTQASFILFVTLLWQSLAMADYNSVVKCSYSSEILVSTNFVTFAFYRESSISIHARHKISVLTIFDCT